MESFEETMAASASSTCFGLRLVTCQQNYGKGLRYLRKVRGARLILAPIGIHFPDVLWIERKQQAVQVVHQYTTHRLHVLQPPV
jgi:hypothetical protein